MPRTGRGSSTATSSPRTSSCSPRTRPKRRARTRSLTGPHPLAGLVPKITDFGLARSLQDQSGLTKTGFAVGTPEYMAPEQAERSPRPRRPGGRCLRVGSDPLPAPDRSAAVPGRESGGGALRDRERRAGRAAAHQVACPSRPGDDRAEGASRRSPRTATGRPRPWAKTSAATWLHEPILARPPRVWERLAKWARREPRLAGPRRFVGPGHGAGPRRPHRALASGRTRERPGSTQLARSRARNIQAKRNERAARARYRADIGAAASALQLNHTETARAAAQLLPVRIPQLGVAVPAQPARQLPGRLPAWHGAGEPGRLSPDCGRVIYANAHESTLHLRDVAAERDIATLRGHEGEILSLAWSRDGSRVASSSADGTVRLWDGATGRPLAVLRGHARPADKMYFSDNSSRLVTHSSESDVRIWDVARGTLIRTLPDVKGIRRRRASAPTGSGSPSSRSGQIQRVGDRYGCRAHCPGLRLAGIDARVQSRRDAARGGDRLPAEPRMALGRRQGSDARDDGWAHQHDQQGGVQPGRESNRLRLARPDLAALGLREGTACHHPARAFGQGHRRDTSIRMVVASCPASLDGTLRLWDTHDRESVCVFRGESRVDHFAISRPDGSVLASVGSDGSVHFWDVERVKHEGVLGRHASFVYDVAFSPSGRTVASAGWDGTVRLWNPRTGRSIGVLRHPDDIVTFVKFDPDGQRLVSVCRPNRVCTWDLVTGRSLESRELTGGEYMEQRVAFLAGGGPGGIDRGSRRLGSSLHAVRRGPGRRPPRDSAAARMTLPSAAMGLDSSPPTPTGRSGSGMSPAARCWRS